MAFGKNWNPGTVDDPMNKQGSEIANRLAHATDWRNADSAANAWDEQDQWNRDNPDWAINVVGDEYKRKAAAPAAPTPPAAPVPPTPPPTPAAPAPPKVSPGLPSPPVDSPANPPIKPPPGGGEPTGGAAPPIPLPSSMGSLLGSADSGGGGGYDVTQSGPMGLRSNLGMRNPPNYNYALASLRRAVY